MSRDPRVGCGTAIILYQWMPEEPARIWLGLRSSTLETGKWGMPGGWLDFGEQPIDGVIRELKEETGLDYHPLSIEEHGMFAHPLPSIDCWCATLYFKAEWNPRRPHPWVMEPDKMSQWRLFSKDELARLDREGKLMGSIPQALFKFYGAF